MVINPLVDYSLITTRVLHMTIGGRKLRWKKEFTLLEFFWRKQLSNLQCGDIEPRVLRGKLVP